MTLLQKDNYLRRYEIEDYLCYFTGKQATQIAHLIANTKVNRKIYEGWYIDHHFNLCPVSSLELNDRCNIGFKPELCKKLIRLIDTFGNDDLTCREINRLLGA